MHPPSMEWLQELYPELDVYTLDHRGTGYSGFLECPDQQSVSSPGGLGYTFFSEVQPR